MKFLLSRQFEKIVIANIFYGVLSPPLSTSVVSTSLFQGI